MGILAAAVIAADQVALWAVKGSIRRGDDWASASALGIGRNGNDGIASGLFTGSGRAIGAASLLILPLIALALGALARVRPVAAISGGLLLGGSASNLTDRLLRGGVTDYLEVGRAAGPPSTSPTWRSPAESGSSRGSSRGVNGRGLSPTRPGHPTISGGAG